MEKFWKTNNWQYNGIQFNTFQPFFSNPAFRRIYPEKWQDWPKNSTLQTQICPTSRTNQLEAGIPRVEPLSPSVKIQNPAANAKKMQLKCSLIRKCCAVRDEETKSPSQLPVPLHVAQVWISSGSAIVSVDVHVLFQMHLHSAIAHWV